MLYELIHFLAYKIRRQSLIGNTLIITGLLSSLPSVILLMKDGFSPLHAVVLSYTFIIIFVGFLMVLESFIKIRTEYSENTIKDNFSSKYSNIYIESAAEECLNGIKGKGCAFGDEFAAFCTDNYKIFIIRISDIVWIYRYKIKVNFFTYKTNMIINTVDKTTYTVPVNYRIYQEIYSYFYEDIIFGYNKNYKALYDSDPVTFRSLCDRTSPRDILSENHIMTGNTIADVILGIISGLFENEK
ncbi:MAG: hypothetical protein IJ736_15680 [Firmicutes bacterium]|nr:hypothetical protein [Bacillota bacterium]